jgi:hypothetical protein
MVVIVVKVTMVVVTRVSESRGRKEHDHGEQQGPFHVQMIATKHWHGCHGGLLLGDLNLAASHEKSSMALTGALRLCRLPKKKRRAISR